MNEEKPRPERGFFIAPSHPSQRITGDMADDLTDNENRKNSIQNTLWLP